MNTWEMYGMMPNQATGVYNGKDLYFRARHGYWTLELNGSVVAEGEDERAGWWSVEEATEFLELVIKDLEMKDDPATRRSY